MDEREESIKEEESLRMVEAEEEAEKPPEEEGEESGDAIQIYLREIRKSPLLSSEREEELALRVSQGDERARNEMIESNLRLVVKIAKKYLHRGLALSDLIEEGNIGLIKAVTRFSPDRKTRFSTYATWWIKQSIERALANQSRIIRLPVHVASDLGRLMRAAKALNQSLGKEPSIEEIAEEMKVSSQDVNGLMELIRKTYSIENFVSDDSTYQLADVIKDESSEKPFFLIDNLERVVEITSWLEALSQTERRVVSYRYGLGNEEPMTLEAIGKIMGVTRERIRQIENKALLKLRRFMKKKDIVFEETV